MADLPIVKKLVAYIREQDKAIAEARELLEFIHFNDTHKGVHSKIVDWLKRYGEGR